MNKPARKPVQKGQDWREDFRQHAMNFLSDVKMAGYAPIIPPELRPLFTKVTIGRRTQLIFIPTKIPKSKKEADALRKQMYAFHSKYVKKGGRTHFHAQEPEIDEPYI